MNSITFGNTNNRKYAYEQPVTQIRTYKFAQPQEQNSLQDNTTKAIGVATLLKLAQVGIKKISEFCGNALMRGKEFASAEDVYKTAEYMKNKNGLKAAIHFIDNSNKSILQRKFPSLANDLEIVSNGQNAFYTSKHDFAIAPKSKPSLILHELGHAINFEKSKVMKALQKMRPLGAYAPMALVFLNRSAGKSNDGKKNFWENNAGKIGFMTMLPTIIEEGVASLRGIKAAKKVLNNPSTLKILKRNYFLAWMTYVLAGVGVGLATKLAITEDK